MKKILCIDFDGVIHSYTSGWKGATNIPDPPVAGALEFLKEAVNHFTVMIYSSRSGQEGGIKAMGKWLIHHATIGKDHSDISLRWLLEIEWPKEKPPAFVTIDDRGIRFTGEWPSMEELKAFKTWQQK